MVARLTGTDEEVSGTGQMDRALGSRCTVVSGRGTSGGSGAHLLYWHLSRDRGIPRHLLTSGDNTTPGQSQGPLP